MILVLNQRKEHKVKVILINRRKKVAANEVANEVEEKENITPEEDSNYIFLFYILYGSN